MAWTESGWTCEETISRGYPHPITAAVTIYDGSNAYSVFKVRPDSYPYADTTIGNTVTRAPRKWSYAGVCGVYAIDTTYQGYPHAGAEADGAFPSADYRAAISAHARKTALAGSIKLKNGTKILLTDDIIATRSLAISTNAMLDDTFLPGGTPSAELRVTLLLDLAPEEIAGAEISPVFRIWTRLHRWYDVPLGTFTAALPEDDTTQGITVTAYDDMHALGGVDRDEIGLSAGKTYSAQELIARCAQTVGLTFEDDISELPNAQYTYEVSAADKRIETARDLLGFVAQILCSFAYVDRWRKLRIVPLVQPEIPATEITEHQRTSLRIARQPYRLWRLYATTQESLGDGLVEIARRAFHTLETEGVEAELPENPLMPVSDQIGNAIIASGILPKLDVLTAYPFTADIYGDPALEPFDWITISGRGLTITSPITRYEWRYRDGMTITCAGMDAVLGVARTMSEKAALASRIAITDADAERARISFLLQVTGFGHQGMGLARHNELAHYTHAELMGDDE